MERERQIFECEIEALKKELKEVNGNKVESGRQNAKGKNRSLEKASEPTCKRLTRRTTSATTEAMRPRAAPWGITK